jgi:hypothetical protein
MFVKECKRRSRRRRQKRTRTRRKEEMVEEEERQTVCLKFYCLRLMEKKKTLLVFAINNHSGTQFLLDLIAL